jgi:hypothetical protein
VFGNVLGGFQFVGPEAALPGLARARGVRAVVPDDELQLDDIGSWGFFRIDADVSLLDPAGPYRGAGARVAIIDSGIDTDHPDLAPNIDAAHWYDCVAPGTTPEDDNGHGTHVAGIAAAAFNADGYGTVGVAPSASIVPIKSFDANGNGSTSAILCGFDHLASVTRAAPMPTALNMSFEDVGGDTQCDDGVVTDALHEGLCDLVTVGQTAGVPIVPVAAAGNSDIDAAQGVPAAFSDVITVSALADFDGAPGGASGCPYIPLMFNWECDDTLASFSNWGTTVDLAAPGVEIYSTVPGGHDTMSGTSMAAPHVTGLVAVVLSEHATLDTAGVRTLLRQTGECPDGTEAGLDASCAGQGGWQKTSNRSLFDPLGTEPDPDGVAEPLVNAGRAARAADAAGDPAPPPPVDRLPQVLVVSPASGATVSGSIWVSGTSSDDHGVTGVQVFVDGSLVGTTAPAADGTWSLAWDTTSVSNGAHSITAVATDTASQTAMSPAVSVTVSNVTSPTSTRVGALWGSAVARAKSWTATATIQVTDSAGAPLAGVTAKLSFGPSTAAVAAPGGNKPPPSSSGALSCVTGADGRCSVSTKPSGSSVRFTVTDLVYSSWSFDVGASVDPDPSTPGVIDLVVVRPT